MARRISARIKQVLFRYGSGLTGPSRSTSCCLDLQDEYANAFRTESYTDFWDRVLALSNPDLTSSQSRSTGSPSTTADRLSSYRLFVDQLLEPDQPTISRILELTNYGTAHKSLLTEYFSETANASTLCSVLLKDIDRTRIMYGNMKSALKSSCVDQGQDISARLADLLNSSPGPLVTSASREQVGTVQSVCSKLFKKLESARDRVRSKLRIISNIKNGSATLLVALTATLVIVIMAHGVPMLVAAPGFLAASFELASPRVLAKMFVQLDAAVKGTYILKKDMDTIGRLVSRLNDDLEHTSEMARTWLERAKGGCHQAMHSSSEVTRRLEQNDCSLTDQMDELEEHLYLCLMTINRARNLVMKEIIDPGSGLGQPVRSLEPNSSP